MHTRQSSESFGGFVSDHLSLEAISIDEDGFEVRDGFGVLDLAKDVGEFMLQKGRGIGEAW